MSSFLSDFETAVNTNFFSIVGTVSANVINVFQGAFVTGFMIWIMLIAYEVAWGKTEDGMTYILTRIGKIFLIGTLALWGWPAIADLMYALQAAFMTALSGSPTISAALENNILNPLALQWFSLIDGLVLSFQLFNIWNMTQFLGLFFGGIVLLIAFVCLVVVCAVICIVTLAMYCISLASFYILLAIGPFFLMCLAFPFLQRYFETWVGATFTAILAMALTALLATTTAALLNLGSLAPSFPVAGVSLTAGGILSLVVYKVGFGLLLIYLFFKVFDLASALGGGMNMGSNMVGSMRQLARAMNSPPKPPKPPSPPGGEIKPSAPTARAQLANAMGASARSVGRGVVNVGRGVATVGQHTAQLGAYAYNRGVAALRSRVQ